MLSNADRAIASDMPEREIPISERFRMAGEAWVDAHSAAYIMEELKTTTLQKLKSKLIAERGPMADNQAERLAKSLPEWEQYIKDMCANRAKADRAKVQMKYWEMRYGEWNSREANARVERRM